ncbi:CoA-binding protein [Thermodesulfobacteriota bacterium]
MDKKNTKILDRMFKPKSIAVFGAMNEPGKYGRMIIQSLIKYGFQGKIYPIYPGGGEIYGLKVYRNISEIEEPIELAKVCVPASNVPQVLLDCLDRGVLGAEVQSSGFAETGEEAGIELQNEITRIANKGLRVLGPNCFGVHNPKGRITLLPGFNLSKQSGPVALIAQSGGMAMDFALEARMAGFGLSKVISYGNGCDLEAIKLLDYLSEDSDTSYVGVYIEGVENGKKFFDALKQLTAKKPTVVWIGGVTPLGKRAALSHTGSLSGSWKIWKGLLAQAGALAVEGLEELVDTMMALVHLDRVGRNVALVGASGAVGVTSSDLAHRWDLTLPITSKETQLKLKKHFPSPGVSLANPLDTGLPFISIKVITEIMKEVLTREPVDVLVVFLQLHALAVEMPTFMEMDGIKSPSLESYLDGLLKACINIRQKMDGNVIIVIRDHTNRPVDSEIDRTCRSILPRFYSAGIPVYPSVKRAFRAIRNVTKKNK